MSPTGSHLSRAAPAGVRGAPIELEIRRAFARVAGAHDNLQSSSCVVFEFEFEFEFELALAVFVLFFPRNNMRAARLGQQSGALAL